MTNLEKMRRRKPEHQMVKPKHLHPLVNEKIRKKNYPHLKRIKIRTGGRVLVKVNK